MCLGLIRLFWRAKELTATAQCLPCWLISKPENSPTIFKVWVKSQTKACFAILSKSKISRWWSFIPSFLFACNLLCLLPQRSFGFLFICLHHFDILLFGNVKLKTLLIYYSWSILQEVLYQNWMFCSTCLYTIFPQSFLYQAFSKYKLLSMFSLL